MARMSPPVSRTRRHARGAGSQTRAAPDLAAVRTVRGQHMRQWRLVLAAAKIALDHQQASGPQQPRHEREQQREAGVAEAAGIVRAARAQRIEQQFLDLVLAAQARAVARREAR
jgi:hypothetical protein